MYKNFLMSVQVAPIHKYHVYCEQFKNLNNSFREEVFLGICSCSYSEGSPHSPEPCVWTDKNFAKNGSLISLK